MDDVRNGFTPNDENYIKQISLAQANGAFLYARSNRAAIGYPDAVSVLRKTLAGQPDGSVVIISIGLMTNLARLLMSSADEFSPLSGTKLVAQKVKQLSCMAGNFSQIALECQHKQYAEYNIVMDIASALHLVRMWPFWLILPAM